jgi:hypothetical protein
MSNFIVIGTWNTKKGELEFVCNEIEKRSHRLSAFIQIDQEPEITP